MADDGSNHGENENLNHNDPPMLSLREYLQTPRSSTPSCIIFSHQGNNFNFKPGIIPLLPKFHGIESENPYLHIKEFEEVCFIFHDQTCSEELVRLKLFSFSLKDKTKTWLNALKPRTTGTWQDMQTEFFKKFFPIHRTNALKRQIINFVQKENETFYQCWKRFKDLLSSCPCHGYEIWRTINFFYEGLMFQMRQFVEMMCNDEFLNKDPNEAWKYFDHLAENAQS
jgi:hypothetical protein